MRKTQTNYLGESAIAEEGDDTGIFGVRLKIGTVILL